MLKVLIAEDEPLSLQNLSGQMRDLLGADALIEGVANGREAVERARQIQPQLVLMDIEMPVMNGLDAAAIIHKAMPETHIVFLTAFDRFDYAVGAMRAGGTDYLVKPFAEEELERTRRSGCRSRQRTAAQAESAAGKPSGGARGQAGKYVLHPVFRVAGASLHAGCVA